MKKQDIQKLLHPFMLQHGFTLSKGHYVRVQNDILFGIGLDSVSSVQCHIYVMPLYKRYEYIVYTYGAEVDYISDYAIQAFPKVHIIGDNPVQIVGSTPEEAELWINQMCIFLRKTVFPYFNSISSPRELLFRLKYERLALKRFMRCPEFHLDILQMYTHLYLHKTEEIPVIAHRVSEEVSNISTYTQTYQKQIQDEVDWILSQLPRDSKEVDAAIRQNVTYTIQNCCPKLVYTGPAEK